ncbi:hypothetical protein AVEN_142592-1 [Araneus ventricosus]|uniref:Uncharacterized protein n=1 Tax=Araneus ventricosus TaxID=182803 RepID=A0A4Y2CH84_ARAVE|nr:hypothetical protein AVEN_142592-1 [Araneus ventricosus]
MNNSLAPSTQSNVHDLHITAGTRRSGSTPALPKHPGQLNDSHCNSSSTEAGVLKAYHQATGRHPPKEVHTITGEGTHSPTITIPQEKRAPAYLPGGHSSGEGYCSKSNKCV